MGGRGGREESAEGKEKEKEQTGLERREEILQRRHWSRREMRGW